jgi:hypothetical protein
MEFRFVRLFPNSWTVSSFQRIYYTSLRCDFVVHSDLETSIEVCRYLLYSFITSSFKKKHVRRTHGCYSDVNVSSSLSQNYVRIEHDVAASSNVRLKHGRYKHGTSQFVIRVDGREACGGGGWVLSPILIKVAKARGLQAGLRSRSRTRRVGVGKNVPTPTPTSV